MVGSLVRDVFHIVWRNGGRRVDNPVAVIVVLRHITCPHCSAILGAKTMGLVVDRVDRQMYVEDVVGRRPNPGFRETHLSNPLKCPVCGGEFYAFVGVEYDRGRNSLKGIDVRIVPSDEDVVEDLRHWPHRGLVMRHVIEYTPFKALVFENQQHFEEYYQGNTDDIVASSLIASDRVNAAPPGQENGRGQPRVAML